MRFGFAVAALSIAMAWPASAQTPPQVYPGIQPNIPPQQLQPAQPQTQPQGQSKDEVLKKVIQNALDNIQRSICEPEKLCTPATDEERKNPPITIEEADQILNRATLSGVALHCKVEWQRTNYLPMMSYWRNRKFKNPRQMALIGLMHGIFQAQIAHSLVQKGPCPDEVRKSVEARIEFKPPQ